ncbi:recombinase family protein [Poseidonocella pacifica]
MIIGYARVSTIDQNLDAKTDALTTEGAERLFSERVSGAI